MISFDWEGISGETLQVWDFKLCSIFSWFIRNKCAICMGKNSLLCVSQRRQ